MRGRKLRWVVAGLVPFIGLFVISRWLARPDWRAADRIREGMTRAEIETLVGCPPGAYGTHEPVSLFDDWRLDVAELHEEGTTYLAWTDDHHGLLVWVQGQSGRAILVLHPAIGPGLDGYEAGPWEAFCWRVKRQWRRWFP